MKRPVQWVEQLVECKPQLIAGLVFDGRKAWNVQRTQILMQAYMAPSSRHPRASPPQIWSCANTWWKKQDLLTGWHRPPWSGPWEGGPRSQVEFAPTSGRQNVKWIFKRALTTVVACTRCPLKKAVLSALWTDARDFVKGDGQSKEVLRWPEVPWAARIGELVCFVWWWSCWKG